jgi:hypothetical protein
MFITRIPEGPWKVSQELSDFILLCFLDKFYVLHLFTPGEQPIVWLFVLGNLGKLWFLEDNQ